MTVHLSSSSPLSWYLKYFASGSWLLKIIFEGVANTQDREKINEKKKRMETASKRLQVILLQEIVFSCSQQESTPPGDSKIFAKKRSPQMCVTPLFPHARHFLLKNKIKQGGNSLLCNT